MQSFPRVTIIIAVYCAADYLERCLRSFAVQTFPGFEVVCDDDCSPDETAEILRRFCAGDRRFRTLFNSHRMGGGASLNRAFSGSNSEYVYFMDPDDALHPHMPECVTSFADREKADVVSFRYRKNAVYQADAKLSCGLDAMPYRLETHPFFKMGKGGRCRVYYTYWTKFYRRTPLRGILFLEGTESNPHILSDFYHTAPALSGVYRCVQLKEELYLYNTCNPGSETEDSLTIKRIRNYHFAVCKLLSQLGEVLPDSRKHLRNYLVSSVVRSQYRRLVRLRAVSPEAYSEARADFRRELQDLMRRDLLSRRVWRRTGEWLAVYRILLIP